MNKLFLRGSLVAGITFSALMHASSALSLNEDFRLLGLAVHQETGRDIYLGAIHLYNSAPIPEKVIQSRAPKMMEYRVLARRTSIRSLVGKMLLQSEVANGAPPNAETIEFADQLLSSVQGSLYAGDSLEIKQNAYGELTTFLNNTKLTITEDSGVFNYLLNGWVSENGPSTAFRGSILQQNIKASMLSAYEAIAPSGERLAAISKWSLSEHDDATEPPTEQLSEAVSDEAAAMIDVTDSSPVRAPVAQENSATVSIEQLAGGETEEVFILPDIKQEQTLVATIQAGQGDLASVQNQTVTFEQNQNTFFETPSDIFEGAIVDTSAARSLASRSEAREVWSFENKTRAAPVPIPGTLEDEAFDILSLDVTEYSQRLAEFNTGLIRLVYSKIRYPRRAIRRSIQGTLELDVTVLEDGSLVAVALVESSGYSILDEAAIEAAQQALEETSLGKVDPVAVAEFGVNGSLVIPVPVNFVLQD
ncbi:MAG: TonB family protein [Halioglobus sp.]|jgi:TonB family protein